MLPEERDAASLWDMCDAARDIISWVGGISYDHFCENEMLHSAVERKLEVFGEAATRISAEMQDAHPEIPWKDIKRGSTDSRPQIRRHRFGRYLGSGNQRTT